MLASITPLGERGRSRRWAVTAGWYVAGSALGGAILGGMAAAVSLAARLVGAPRGAALLATAAAVCLAGLLVDSGVLGLRPPGPHRQVNEDWLHRYRGWVIGLGFGLQLGAGVTTIVTTAALYSALLVAALVSPVAAVVAGVSFGLARALPLSWVRRAVDPASVRLAVGRVASWARPAAAATLAVQAVAVLGLGLAVLLPAVRP